MILTPSTIKVTPRYRRHMIGTIFDVNRIILFKPPEMIIAAIITMITPTIQCGTPKSIIHCISNGVRLCCMQNATIQKGCKMQIRFQTIQGQVPFLQKMKYRPDTFRQPFLYTPELTYFLQKDVAAPKLP